MASFLGSGSSFLELHCDPVYDEFDHEESDCELGIAEETDETLTLDEIGFSYGPTGGLVVHSEESSAKPIFKKSRVPAGLNLGKLNENECGICLNDISPSERFTLSCRHAYCKDCLSYYLNQLSGDHRNIFHTSSALETTDQDQHYLRIKETCGIACPHPKCTHIIEGAEFREAADERTWDRFCRISLSVRLKHLTQQGQLTPCGGTCPGYIQNCICTEEHCLNKKTSRPIREPSLSHQWAVESGVAVCPKCHNLVERSYGCDHMRCNCKTLFSYRDNQFSYYANKKRRIYMKDKK